MHDSKIHCQQPDADSLTCYQTYRDTPAGAAELKAHARLAGIGISELTRRRVHGHSEPKAAAPAVNLELYGALKHTTDNFNQMTKNSNQQVLAGQQMVVDFAICIALLKKMDVQVAALRADLLGASKK
jgi:hypothetical protein